MNRLKGYGLLIIVLTLFAFVGTSQADMVTIYGPVYVSKTKKDSHEKDSEFKFTAAVAGNGVIVIRNGGDSNKDHRVSSAEVEFNDEKIASERDFNKNVEELRYDVTLQADNELEVEVKSCKKCELEITVLGEASFPSRTSFPSRGSF